MINVVFLLLIFFMLVGAVRTRDLFEIEPLISRSETSAGQMEAVVLIDRQGRLALDGVETDEEGLRAAISARMDGMPELVVHLKADGRVSTPRVVETMELMRDTGIKRLVLLTLEPES